MMDSQCSQVSESNQLVVPSSQIDSESDLEEISLSALRTVQPEENTEVVYPVMDPSGVKGHLDHAVLVADSEVESADKADHSSDGLVIEETVAEDTADSDIVTGTSSDEAANVTVIARGQGYPGQQTDNDEDCVSQDLFFVKRDDENKKVVTPSQTLPNLQLSGSAMLVPETMEESLGDQEICPSPNAYGYMPLMIPSTPTASQTSVAEGQGECTPSSASTLRSLQKDPKLFAIMDMAQCQIETSGNTQSEPVMEPVGPVPEWQQSQSLLLHLSSTTSASQLSTQHQSTHSLNKNEKSVKEDRAAFGRSQSPCHLSDPEDSSLQHSGVFRLSVPVRVTPLQPSSEPAAQASPELVPAPSSRDATSSSTFGTPGRPVMSVASVHSDSQGMSDTVFRLERPDVMAMSGTLASIEPGVPAENETMNIFHRTRRGIKLAAVKSPTTLQSDESVNLFVDIRKAPEKVAVQSLSDSDPIPCSQKRQVPKSRQHNGNPLTDKTDESLLEVREAVDAFSLDTVMDSEPEDEGTQPYEVFPALSKKQLLPCTEVSPGKASIEYQSSDQQAGSLPQPAAAGSQHRATDLQPQIVNSRHLSATGLHAVAVGSQIASAGSQPVVVERNLGTVGNRAVSSQPVAMSGPLTSQSAAVSSQPVKSSTGLSSQQLTAPKSQPKASKASKTRVQFLTVDGKNVGCGDSEMTEEAVVNKTPSMSPEIPRSLVQAAPTLSSGAGMEKLSGNVAPKPVDISHLELPATSVAGQTDPNLFQKSQSQLKNGADLSRTTAAETSTGIMQDGANKSKRMSCGRRQKCFVKKKLGENKGKSSSTSTDEAIKGATKQTRNIRRASKFTKLVPTNTVLFKTPEEVRNKKCKDKAAAKETVVVSRASIVPSPAKLSQTRPRAGSRAAAAAAAGGSAEQTVVSSRAGQDKPSLTKSESQDFAGTLIIASPTQPPQMSLELCLTDSQSSDVLLEVTMVKEYTKQYKQRVTTVQLINKDGQIMQEKSSKDESDHVIIEESEMYKKRRISMPPSPSRTNSTLTSGDLGDISSSSQSARGLGSSSSLERAPSSLELSQPSVLPIATAANAASNNSLATAQTNSGWQKSAVLSASASMLECAEAGNRQSLGGRSSAAASPATISFLSPMQSSIEREDSRLDAVVTSSSGGRSCESLFSADNASGGGGDFPPVQPPVSDRSGAALTSSSSSTPSSDVIPPTDLQKAGRVQVRMKKLPSPAATDRTPTALRSRKSARRAAADSSQEEKKQQLDTRRSSIPESQAFVAGMESGGFSVRGLSGSGRDGSSGRKKKSSTSSVEGQDGTLKQQVESTRARRKSPASASESGSADNFPTASTSALKPDQISNVDVQPVVKTVSKLDIGARVMCRWKDGVFYPAVFIGLNTGIGNKFKVVFEDGLEKTVRAVDLVMAQNIPTGQSVLVVGEDGASDPGIVVGHFTDCPQFADKGEAMYEIDMDNGKKIRCKRSDLLLTEDQASLLLGDEEYRATFGSGDMAVNTADVSLDNVILGKRLRMKGSPAVGVPRQSQSGLSSSMSDSEAGNQETAGSSLQTTKGSQVSQDTESSTSRKSTVKNPSASKSSGRKRKVVPVATSTPTPKLIKMSTDQHTPKKATRESFSPLGAAVVSPEDPKRSNRKARIGLFDNTKGPIPSNSELFSGHVFVLTHVFKTPQTLAEEKMQLQVSCSTDESSEDERNSNTAAFDKLHLRAQILSGGGTLLQKLDSDKISTHKGSLYCISDTYQRTVKYFQCLAANIPIVSFLWIRDSCVQNELLDLKAYILPAGISLEKHQLTERTFDVACLKDKRVLLASTNDEYIEVWTSILGLSSCKVLTKLPPNASKHRPAVDVIVADHTCPQSLVNKAGSLGVPLVASEWVIQCLVNNALMPYDGHPRYVYNYFKDVAAAVAASQTSRASSASDRSVSA